MVSHLNNQKDTQASDWSQLHVLFERWILFLQGVKWWAPVSQAKAEHLIIDISNTLPRAADINRCPGGWAGVIDYVEEKFFHHQFKF